MPVPEWGLRVVMVVRQRQRGLGRDAPRSVAKKRCGLPMPAAAATPGLPANAASGRVAPPLDLARVAGSSHIRAWRGRAAGAASGGPGTPTLVTTASTSRSGRFAQRAGRQQAAIADPALVLHHDFTSRQVLQAVVRDDHVHVGMRAAAPGQPARAWDARPSAPLRARAIRRARRRMPTQPAPRPVRRAARGRSSRRSLG